MGESINSENKTRDELVKINDSKLRTVLTTVLVATILLGGMSLVAYAQGWIGSNSDNVASATQDESKLDGFETEIDSAVALISEKKSNEASEILQRILAQAPNHILANYNLGVIAQFDGRLDDAIQHYTTSLMNAPKFRSALYNRGLAFRDSGNIDQAIRDLEMVIADYPNAASAAYNLGKMLIEKGDLETGNAFLERAKKLDPTLGN